MQQLNLEDHRKWVRAPSSLGHRQRQVKSQIANDGLCNHFRMQYICILCGRPHAKRLLGFGKINREEYYTPHKLLNMRTDRFGDSNGMLLAKELYPQEPQFD